MISLLTKPYPVLTGYYWFMYFILEPLSLILTWITVFLDRSKGALWFYNELVPSVAPLTVLDPRATTAMWHITNTYLLMAVAELMLHTNIRDRVQNLADQERAVGLVLAPLGVADVSILYLGECDLPEYLSQHRSDLGGIAGRPPVEPRCMEFHVTREHYLFDHPLCWPICMAFWRWTEELLLGGAS
ncbi:hypothetical protein BDN72DRAFT_899480 [Pluteus cervinus]|uniref:Uncharacterized protein n=1 Tax=Pluteus cervinus TaxID=181527 RepID=A0ACD3AMM2_9AGAR|nr:hypothetical protein BDN72DRAFT_899480 [Pluteus cervinus]